MPDDVTGFCPSLRTFHPVIEVELGDGVDQLLGLEVGGDGELG